MLRDVRRCEWSLVLVISGSPWCHYFCAMMQASSFISEMGEKTQCSDEKYKVQMLITSILSAVRSHVDRFVKKKSVELWFDEINEKTFYASRT